MRALILFNSLMVGGSERKGVRLANELHDRGMTVSVAYLCDPSVLLSEINKDIPATCLERSGKYSLKALLNLRRYVKANDVAVVLCMNQYPLLYAAPLKLLIPSISLRIILAVNTTDFERERDRWFMLIYGPLMKITETVIYGCKNQLDLWRQKYKLRNESSQVIYNGVDSNYFDGKNVPDSLRQKLNLSDHFVIGCVGRLDIEKNQSALLKVAAKLNRDIDQMAVLLVGSGPERERLERLSVELGIRDCVHFLGRTDDVRHALVAMDVFVLPSISVETFSNAALEAMAMSLPVILSDIGGAAEMVIDGENGFLYGRHDVERLATLLLALEADHEKRQLIGRRARETVLDRFGFGRMVDAYERVLSNP